MGMDTDRFRVRPGKKVRLDERNPGDDGDIDKATGRELTEVLRAELETLQEMLYVDARHKMLVVLQAMDAGGKDGTIRTCSTASTRRACRSPPSRAHRRGAGPRLPLADPPARARGRARSASSTAPTTRTCSSCACTTWCPRSVWQKRYEQINDFEQHARRRGHHDPQVLPPHLQGRAAQAPAGAPRRPDEALEVQPGRPRGAQALGRLPGGLRGRARRDCSTEHAPWYVIPANRKWYRNLVVSQIIVDKLRSLDLRYPEPEPDLDGLVLE